MHLGTLVAVIMLAHRDRSNIHKRISFLSHCPRIVVSSICQEIGEMTKTELKALKGMPTLHRFAEDVAKVSGKRVNELNANVVRSALHNYSLSYQQAVMSAASQHKKS